MFLLKENKKKNFNIWIKKIRNLGGISFLEGQIIGKKGIGLIHVVVKKKELLERIKNLKLGDLVRIIGSIKEKKGGGYELILSNLKLINKSSVLPFVIDDSTIINEDTKYRYRYLDLRIAKNISLLKIKSDFLHETRCFFHRTDFLEVETPILSQYSPEGASFFKVLLDSQKKFFVLSQSPQIFKQLLMISGVGRYFQIAKCFRDEGARSDRQIEFSQLDVEESFTTLSKLILLIERYLKKILLKVFKKNDKFDLRVNFTKMTYFEVIRDYKSEKPDLRKNKLDNNDLRFVWITDWPLFKYDELSGSFVSLRHPFTNIKKIFVKQFLKEENLEEVIGECFDLVCNGEEIISGGMRIHQRDMQQKVFSILGYSEKEIEENFGYFLRALGFASPPHGGFGLGIDRLLMVILGSKNIKELLAFPKNIDGGCSLTGAPFKIKN